MVFAGNNESDIMDPARVEMSRWLISVVIDSRIRTSE